MDETRITTALDKGEQAFWAAIAAQFPEADHGDLPPDIVIKLRAAMESAIWDWVGLNVD